MRSLSWHPIPRGQAAVEAMLALTVIGALMHSVVIVGEVWLRGQHAAQSSRVAVFASALGVPDATTDDRSHVVMDSVPWNRGLQPHIGNVHAFNMARDWLHIDNRLRRARATGSPTSAPAFAAHGEPAALLSVRRETVMATGAGHGIDDTTVSRRIQESSIGWSRVAQRSMRAAQIVGRRMEPVDAPWSRGAWSIDWLSGWANVGPRSTQSSNPNHSGRQ